MVSLQPPVSSRVREQPTVKGKYLRDVPPGEFVTIINGPRCADGYTWWQIKQKNGLTGWTAEGDKTSYWLVPSVTPAATPQTLAAARQLITVLNAADITQTLWLHTDIATKTVYSMAFSPDNRLLAIGAYEAAVVWDLTSGRVLWADARDHNYMPPQDMSVTFSPDSKLLAIGQDDGTVRLFDVASGQEVRVLKGHSSIVQSVAFSPDGRFLASGANDTVVKLWDIQSGNEIRTLGHTHWVTRVTFSPDGQLLASTSMDGTVWAWNIPEGQELWKIKGYFGGIAFSPDGRILAAGVDGPQIAMWNVDNWKEVRTLESALTPGVLAFSPDGRLLALAGGEKGAEILESASDGIARQLRMLPGLIRTIAFSPDGTLLATGESNGTVHLWAVAQP